VNKSGEWSETKCSIHRVHRRSCRGLHRVAESGEELVIFRFATPRIFVEVTMFLLFVLFLLGDEFFRRGQIVHSIMRHVKLRRLGGRYYRNIDVRREANRPAQPSSIQRQYRLLQHMAPVIPCYSSYKTIKNEHCIHFLHCQPKQTNVLDDATA